MTFGKEKQEWCCYPIVKNFEDMFTRLDRNTQIVKDTQMDGRTPDDGIGRTCIASCGKN